MALSTSAQTSSGPDVAHRDLGPLLLEPLLVERIWGVSDLAPWHPGPAPLKPIGEIWLTAEECRVAAGSGLGETLADRTAAQPGAFGDPGRNGFPLLIKLLFPREKLSVQVHPNDAQARAKGMPRGKTECWYILSAEPGAKVAVGFNEPLTQDEIQAAVADGTLEDKLRHIDVHAGDMIFVEAGTVHAIGPGMVVLETQQYSDITYRLWDYGRPRELHTEEGTGVTRTDGVAGLVKPEVREGFTRLVSCEYFAVDRFRLHRDLPVELASLAGLQILIALQEGVTLLTATGATLTLTPGKAAILPASDTACTLRATSDAEVIRVLQP